MQRISITEAQIQAVVKFWADHFSNAINQIKRVHPRSLLDGISKNTLNSEERNNANEIFKATLTEQIKQSISRDRFHFMLLATDYHVLPGLLLSATKEAFSSLGLNFEFYDHLLPFKTGMNGYQIDGKVIITVKDYDSESLLPMHDFLSKVEEAQEKCKADVPGDVSPDKFMHDKEVEHQKALQRRWDEEEAEIAKEKQKQQTSGATRPSSVIRFFKHPFNSFVSHSKEALGKIADLGQVALNAGLDYLGSEEFTHALFAMLTAHAGQYMVNSFISERAAVYRLR